MSEENSSTIDADRNSSPILVALDVPTAEGALRLAEQLRSHVGGYKVGLELLSGPGPAVVGVIARLGRPVFADAKLHDIPNTVRAAARHLGEAGARWITAHAAGGGAMLEAAVEGLAEGAGRRKAGVLAITVLTSLDGPALAATGVTSKLGRLVSCRTRLADQAGCEGVITSVKELGVVADVGPDLLRFTPGIRPAGANTHDQVRSATPEVALARGAHYLIIGRAITEAPNPVTAAERILHSLPSEGEESWAKV